MGTRIFIAFVLLISAIGFGVKLEQSSQAKEAKQAEYEQLDDSVKVRADSVFSALSEAVRGDFVVHNGEIMFVDAVRSSCNDERCYFKGRTYTHQNPNEEGLIIHKDDMALVNGDVYPVLREKQRELHAQMAQKWIEQGL